MFSPAFIRAKNFTLSEKVEGGLSLDPDDDGNWSGGRKGVGELLGSKFGISAAQYPTIDIPMLSFEQAIRIYERDYWQPIKGDELPSRLAMAVFDSAVNQGVTVAIKLLQSVLRVPVDGVMGPQTIAAARSKEQDDSIVDFIAARIMRYARSNKDKFDMYGTGWFRRCARLAMECAR